MQKIFKHISEWVTDRVEALKIMVYILEHELYTVRNYIILIPFSVEFYSRAQIEVNHKTESNDFIVVLFARCPLMVNYLYQSTASNQVYKINEMKNSKFSDIDVFQFPIMS